MKLYILEDAFDEFDEDEIAEYSDYHSTYEGPNIPRFQAIAFYSNPLLDKNAEVAYIFSNGTADDFDDFVIDCMRNKGCETVLARLDYTYSLFHDYNGENWISAIPFYSKDFTPKQKRVFDRYFESNELYPATS